MLKFLPASTKRGQCYCLSLQSVQLTYRNLIWVRQAVCRLLFTFSSWVAKIIKNWHCHFEFPFSWFASFNPLTSNNLLKSEVNWLAPRFNKKQSMHNLLRDSLLQERRWPVLKAAVNFCIVVYYVWWETMGPLAGRLYFEQKRERLHFLQASQRERFCQKLDSLSRPKGAGYLKQIPL